MRHKKKTVAAIFALTLLATSSGIFAEDSNKEYKNFAKQAAEIEKKYEGKNSQFTLNSLEGQLLNEKKYETQVAFNKLISNKSEKEAQQLALEKIIADAAVINKAQDLNLKPSEAEVRAKIKKEKDTFASKKAENYEEVSQMFNVLLQSLGINEDEYWNKYIFNNYVVIVSKEKLERDLNKDGTNSNKWQDFETKTIKEFKKSHESEITSFKKSKGIVN
ncbi:hypothetical protein ACFVVQ_12725 [Paenibacillus chitinolyticus]|uniref:hypothetical protein n=1 Tax=Paenibacillus chitinolyticus TaxID=79263 RepID=UPI0036DA99FF